MNNMVRASPETRQQLINYLQHIIQLNLKRAQMRVDKTQVSSDGLLSNITQGLLNLCDPFLDFRASKVCCNKHRWMIMAISCFNLVASIRSIRLKSTIYLAASGSISKRKRCSMLQSRNLMYFTIRSCQKRKVIIAMMFLQWALCDP
jgi:hypothetical protein